MWASSPVLTKPNSLILADRLCHASLIDGCRLSRATLRIFHHNDLDHLKRLLFKQRSHASTLIITEGVFSMDGDLAPLPEMARMAQEYEATLLVDDAHGTGVMGATGGGTVEHYGLDPAHILQMGTLSKALGSSGGFVAGPKDFVDYLINTSRSFIYSTAPPPAIAAAASAALAIIQQEPQRRAKLWRNRDFLHHGLVDLGFQLTNIPNPYSPDHCEKSRTRGSNEPSPARRGSMDSRRPSSNRTQRNQPSSNHRHRRPLY